MNTAGAWPTHDSFNQHATRMASTSQPRISLCVLTEFNFVEMTYSPMQECRLTEFFGKNLSDDRLLI